LSVSPHWIPTETAVPLTLAGDDPTYASAIGTIDRFCHVLTGEQGHWTGTLCGLALEPIQTYAHEPPPARCPGGHPSCPECAQADGGWS
jgi:hypothetical protein